MVAIAGIEFWYDFASPYSYLSAMRIEDAARRLGVAVAWRPFLLGPILQALGMDDSPFVLQKEKAAHMWQDMVRQCRKYGVRWTKPTIFPRASLLGARIALLGAEEPWVRAFSCQVMERNFALDQSIDKPEDLLPLLIDLGLPATEILSEARAAPIKTRLREQTEQARVSGVFGAPTFFVGNEMFWGNDRLEDALEFAQSLPLRDGG